MMIIVKMLMNIIMITIIYCYNLYLEINFRFEGFIVDHTGESVKSVPMLIFSMTTAFTIT